MKKMILVAVLFLVGILSFANVAVDEMDGTYWVRFSDEQKTFYVAGFLSGVSALPEVIYTYIEAFLNRPLPIEVKEELAEVLRTEATVSQLCEMVDAFYVEEGNQAIPIGVTIVLAIMYTTGVFDEQEESAIPLPEQKPGAGC